MNNSNLAALITRLDRHARGESGHWEFLVGGRTLICLTDEVHDRMRVITPILSALELDEATWERCLEANFDRALDARYCLFRRQLWSAFIHPLGSLTEEQFASGVRQVVKLADNFGGSYSSGELVFAGGH